jgi:adenylate cyclase
MGLRLRSKLILALLGLALIPLAVTTAVVVQVTTRSLESASRSYRVATADYARFTVRQLFDRAESDLGAIGAALAEKIPGPERQRRARALILGSRHVDRVAVYAPSGEHLFTLDSGGEASQIARLPRVGPGVAAIARKQGLAPLAVQKSSKGVYLAPVVTPVFTGKDKRVYAYLWSALPLASLDTQLAELSRRRFGQQDNRVFLVDHQLTIIAHARGVARGRSIAKRGLLKDLPDGETPRQDIAYAAEYTLGDELLLGILVPLGQPLGWSVVVEQRSSEVFRAVRSTWGTALFVGVGFAAAALLIGVMMGSRLARPISAVASAARRVAAGDFEARVPAQGKDEVALMGHAFNQMAQDLRDFRAKLVEETRIRADLGRYLGADVVETIVDGTRSVELGGERREVTVLFADVVAFTPLAEKHAPEHVVGILNELFTFLTEIVFKHGGTVDKFIGDCVMAVFGAPYQHDDDPLRAVRAAEEMLRWLETGNAKWRKDLGRELQLGIGIHTGDALAGNLGSEKRMEYTVIGDSVNVAARLEALAQPGQVLMSKVTAKRVSGEFDVNALGGHKVAGREEELELYELDD